VAEAEWDESAKSAKAASVRGVKRVLSPSFSSSQSRALERLPKWLICVPLVVQWLYLALRHGSASLPSSANPCITAGGLVGEGKREYFQGMGALARAATAPWCAITPGPGRLMQNIHTTMQDAGLVFPVVAKPDLGMCGFGVRLIANASELAHYLAAFPPLQVVVLQAYLADLGEAGIFYARYPNQGQTKAQGRIIGLALRHFPQVTGDGLKTTGELILESTRTRRLLGTAHHELSADTSAIPPAGQVVRLATIGSTRVGGLYTDGGIHITAQLTAAIDAIARDMPQFHFGRFDVRFSSLAELREGRGIKIMEINGAGSEAIEAWDPATPLLDALRIIFAKQSLLFKISSAMRKLGHRPVSLRKLASLHFMQQRLLDQYPPSN
jgi:hypothetical protein